jgi:hypothetical protein
MQHNREFVTKYSGFFSCKSITKRTLPAFIEPGSYSLNQPTNTQLHGFSKL